MEVIYTCCAGLDVQQQIIVAYCITLGTTGEKCTKTRTFNNTTQDILTLSDWLSSNSVTHVALDNTGKFWKTVYNLLEPNFSVLAVNAQHFRDVPGRKTNIEDAAWIAELLRHGLAHSSFIQPLPQPDLRELTHHRYNLVLERASVVDNLFQVLESANVKLASVVSDIMQLSVRAMLVEIAKGETNFSTVADSVNSSLHQQQESHPTHFGRVREHHRFLISKFLHQLELLDKQINLFNTKIADYLQVQKSTANPQASGAIQPNEPATATTAQVVELFPNWEEVWISFLNDRKI